MTDRLIFDPSSQRFTPAPVAPADGLEGVATRAVNGKSFDPPGMSWREVTLRPLRQTDYDFLRVAESEGELSARWRFRGATPGPEQWLQQTWAGVVAQYLVFADPTAPPVGIVTAYEANAGDGHAKIAAARFHDGESSPVMVVAVALLIRHLFAHFNLRKLYMDVPEFNLPQFESLISRYFVEEARLVDHMYFGGDYWDMVTLALYRGPWAEAQRRILPDA